MEGRGRDGGLGGPRTRGGGEGRTHLSLGARLTRLALQAQGAAVTESGDPGSSPTHPQSAPLRLPRTHLLAFLSGKAGHPRVALRRENHGSGALVAGCGAQRALHPSVDASQARCLGARQRAGGRLTTPPRGPVFPGKPWREADEGLGEFPSPGRGSPGVPQHGSALLPTSLLPAPPRPPDQILGPADLENSRSN